MLPYALFFKRRRRSAILRILKAALLPTSLYRFGSSIQVAILSITSNVVRDYGFYPGDGERKRQRPEMHFLADERYNCNATIWCARWSLIMPFCIQICLHRQNSLIRSFPTLLTSDYVPWLHPCVRSLSALSSASPVAVNACQVVQSTTACETHWMSK